jgi:hypothetical protein
MKTIFLIMAFFLAISASAQEKLLAKEIIIKINAGKSIDLKTS